MKTNQKLQITLAAACVGIAIVIWPSYLRSTSMNTTGEISYPHVFAIVLVCLQTAVAFWMIYRYRWFGWAVATVTLSFAIVALVTVAWTSTLDPSLTMQIAAAITSFLLLLRFLMLQQRNGEQDGTGQPPTRHEFE